ncbi:hypothetical protein ACIRSU_25450 [Streptomyces sp. NPDC101160]|uniref:hypothetical protein n=1 Tax=Streptomyces sp. NPDC101160 TaxID=3366118 RepID=UPI0037F622DD
MSEMTTRKPTGRKADPLTVILAEVRAGARAIPDLPAHLVGGKYPDSAVNIYHQRGADWQEINRARKSQGRLGVDGLAVQVAFAAFGGRTPVEIREGLVRLASLAVAAIEQIDREDR